MTAEIVGLAISIDTDQGYYIPILFPNNIDTMIKPEINYKYILKELLLFLIVVKLCI